MGKKSKQKKGNNKKNKKPNKKAQSSKFNIKDMLFSLVVLPMAIFFYEMVFKVSVTDQADGLSILPTLIFAIIYGIIVFFLCSWSKNSKTNFIIKTVMLFILAVPYIVEYFVFKQFKMLYDVPTVVGSARDVAGSRFAMDALEIMTDADGIAHLTLWLFPTLMYLIRGRALDTCKRVSKKYVTILLGVLIALAAGNGVLINQYSKFKDSYDDHYNYPAAVENFGLLTGIRLDVLNLFWGKEHSFDAEGDDDFNIMEGEPIEEEIPEKEEKTVYDLNVMDIDFDAIAERTGGKLANIDEYVQSIKPSSQNEMTGIFEGKNLIFITAEAFSAEAIDPKVTPTLYRLATKGINFTDYYEQATAGTTGGEYQNIFGLLPMRGGASFYDASSNLNYFTMGNQLDRLGYYGMVFHNNDYKYYSRHVTHNAIGYSEGYMGYGNGLEDYITLQWPESDLEMMEATVDMYINHQPFNIYYMSVSGHSNYTFASNKMAQKNRDLVEGMEGSERILSYKAANAELDKAVEYLIKRLEEANIEDDTVIVIAADHFPYGLDNDAAIGSMPYLAELYGYEVTNYLERDHNRLIIWCGEMEKKDPIIVDSPTSSLDILPTLSNLFGTEWDSRLLPGRDVFSEKEALVFNMSYDWKTSYGTYLAGSETFTPSDPKKSNLNWDSYVERINKVVKNKVQYCSEVLRNDYYRHLFEE